MHLQSSGALPMSLINITPSEDFQTMSPITKEKNSKKQKKKQKLKKIQKILIYGKSIPLDNPRPDPANF
ncbi:hypothetical protein BpHYR1_034661 [Brachionus plicatilis]|uniref:Uncharacterized protein n=1 Tax=Brachionus plicatilis TaxID=10195 RepID=A0A3M7SY81_BRAPC|nr:hypothetical protein BpHYR1_034661 [Brachionus plicatilis]